MTRFAVVAFLALGIAEGGRKRRSISTESVTARCGAKGGFLSENVKGRDADQCEWKWQVGLTKHSSPSLPFCGGILLSEEWVLTAAHCVSDPDFYVVAGDWKPLSPTGFVQKVGAEEVHPHPYYTGYGSYYDHAMVKLKTPVIFNACVGPVCLPTSDVALTKTCWVTGWGTLTEDGKQANTLQEVSMDIVNQTDCAAKYRHSRYDIDVARMICAQGHNSEGQTADTCQGESGGPLVCEEGGRWTLQGVSAFGDGCTDPHVPGVWANVFTVTSWIETVMSASYTTKPPVTCPSFAESTSPDRNGNCRCKGSRRCNRPRGKCPASSAMYEWTGNYFLATCEDCKCR